MNFDLTEDQQMFADTAKQFSRVTARGRHFDVYVNGVLVIEWTDNDGAFFMVGSVFIRAI